MKPVLLSVFLGWWCYALPGDTLYTNPHYPPLVYAHGEYDFYKYTPRYVPEDLLQCFRILATSGDEVLQRFIARDEKEVLERGLFERGFRIRKEFCLEGYSPFVHYFFKQGIYYPYSMHSYILLCFHQYLRGERISWRSNRNLSLKGRTDENRAWRKRARKVFRQLNSAEAEVLSSEPSDTDPADMFFQW